MGRNQRKRKQRRRTGSQAVSAARRSAGGGRGGMYAGITVIVVLVVVVAAGVLLTRSRNSTPAAAIPPVQVSATYPTGLQDGVVVAGKPGARTTVDAYEDFLCPVCGAFESQHASNIQQALNASRITVRYHMLNLLTDRSNPPGYSLQAANAGLCAAAAGVFPSTTPASTPNNPRRAPPATPSTS